MTGDVPFAAITQDDESPTSISDSRTDEAGEEDGLPAVAPQQGHFGFTLRELIVAGVWLLAFTLSFVPAAGNVLDGSATVWTMNGAWLLTIGVPTVAVFLLVLRRLSPEGIRRVGSLGIDQFASVAFSVALVSWSVLLWQQLDLVSAMRRSALATWPLWLEVLLLLALVVVTVFGPIVPGIREDFEGRMETLAHRNANPVRPVFTRPRPVRARGSISDPQHEDDVDPGLRHDDEVGADAHLSAGAAGAAIPGAEGYVPDHHRESFVASAPNHGDLGAPGADIAAPAAREPNGAEPSDSAEQTASAEPSAEHPGLSAPAAEAVTEAIPEPGSDDEDEADRSPEPDAADASGGDSAPRELSDTMTEVLGELLEPSPEDEVATHVVEVVSADGDRHGGTASTSQKQAQPFWALAPETRAVHDARGDEIFTIGPDAWILVLEDRGGAFVVRHDDGRVGYLHDTDDMTRG